MATTRRARLGPERLEEIADLAEAVAQEHCPKLPIEPEAVAAAKGITLSCNDYGDAFDGLLEQLEGRYHIYCNTARCGDLHTGRARFTLAHELGHYFLDEHRLALAGSRPQGWPSLCEYESPEACEQEADAFAAHLLMPTGRFGYAARRTERGLAGIASLAARFGVSITAAAIRCTQLNVWPCAVVKWDWSGYAWKHLSSDVFSQFFRRTFESPALLAEQSPTRRALAHEAPPDCGYFEAGTVASVWFPGVEAGGFRDGLFLEQAMPLGRWGVLTFLVALRS